MDEDALEAMIRRQRQAEQSHDEGPKARLVEDSEAFEVYERPRREPEPEEEAADMHAANGMQARPPSHNADFTEYPSQATPEAQAAPQTPPTHENQRHDLTEASHANPNAAPDAYTPQATQGAQAAHAAGHAATSSVPAGDTVRVAIVQADFHPDVTDAMADWATRRAPKINAEVAHHVHVPGAFDIPLAAQKMAMRDDVDAVVTIGCVIQGETAHDEVITHAVAKQLLEIACQTGKPVALGISGPRMTAVQAEARIVMGRNAMDAAVAQARLTV